MTEGGSYTAEEWHKKMAVDLNTLVWNLLEKEGRDEEEEETMVHAAHASRYHWGQVGTAVNLARGEWLISRVYAVLHRPGSALHHARRCLAICQENDIGDFDIAYAYEGMARAFAAAGEQDDCRDYLRRAREAGGRIKAGEDRDLFFRDLETQPWYGAAEAPPARSGP
jgi:hypothetical protein